MQYIHILYIKGIKLTSRARKNVNFPGSLAKRPASRKLKTIVPLLRRKRNLFSWKRCTQEP